MEITIIGKYGPYAQKGGATSCYLINDSVILDMGSGALARLQEKVNLCKISAIILTHMHSDHISDMFTLRYFYALEEKAGRLDKKIDVYMPYSKSPENEMLSDCRRFNIHYVNHGDIIEIAGLKTEFYAMLHAGIPCLGLNIKQGESSLAYTADTLYCENLETLISKSKFAVCDCAVLSKDFTTNSPHISVEQMAKLCNKYKTYMYISHISTLNESELLSEAKKHNEKCEVVAEGRTYKI